MHDNGALGTLSLAGPQTFSFGMHVPWVVGFRGKMIEHVAVEGARSSSTRATAPSETTGRAPQGQVGRQETKSPGERIKVAFYSTSTIKKMAEAAGAPPVAGWRTRIPTTSTAPTWRARRRTGTRPSRRRGSSPTPSACRRRGAAARASRRGSRRRAEDQAQGSCRRT